MKNKLITIIGSLLTLGLAAMFGVMDKPIEMGIIVVAGVISLALLNIGNIQKPQGTGLGATMISTDKQVNATIEHLREVVSSFAEVILTDLMSDNLTEGMSLEKRLKLHDQLVSNLNSIGASEKQIKDADEMWNKGVGIIFFHGIRTALERRGKATKINTKTEKNILEASLEFQELCKFTDWNAPSSDELREFCVKNEVMHPEIDELLSDYSVFEQSGKFRRRGVFIKL